jgi:type IV secretion system protein VirB4
VFATQSLADIERSSIAPALIESCPTRIFLPNERAREPQTKSIYERFGLNDRQIEILSLAAPKRDYYAQTARGNRLFALGLGPVALAFCGAASPDDQRLIDRCLAAGGPAGFAARYLEGKGLTWAAELVARWQQPTAPAAVARPPPPMPMALMGPEDSSAAVRAGEAVPATPAAAASAAAPLLRRGVVTTGLAGGPALSQRLSPYRVAATDSKGRRT